MSVAKISTFEKPLLIKRKLILGAIHKLRSHKGGGGSKSPQNSP